jgi:YHS domain-containing protein
MAQVIDPVCQMTVDSKTARWSTVFEGQPYYFCAPGCKKSFEREPGRYLSQGQAQVAQAPDGKHHASHFEVTARKSLNITASQLATQSSCGCGGGSCGCGHH